MTDAVHESRRKRAARCLEQLEEKGRDALIDWVQTAIETMELADVAFGELDTDKLTPCVTSNGVGTQKVFPRIKPGGNFKEQDLYIVIPHEQDEVWISICTEDGCAVLNYHNDLQRLGRALLYVAARWPDKLHRLE
jgi:hypothetical protein